MAFLFIQFGQDAQRFQTAAVRFGKQLIVFDRGIHVIARASILSQELDDVEINLSAFVSEVLRSDGVAGLLGQLIIVPDPRSILRFLIGVGDLQENRRRLRAQAACRDPEKLCPTPPAARIIDQGQPQLLNVFMVEIGCDRVGR